MQQPGGDGGLVHLFIWCFAFLFGLLFAVSVLGSQIAEICLLNQCVGLLDSG